jgi:hypothetical protein
MSGRSDEDFRWHKYHDVLPFFRNKERPSIINTVFGEFAEALCETYRDIPAKICDDIRDDYPSFYVLNESSELAMQLKKLDTTLRETYSVVQKHKYFGLNLYEDLYNAIDFGYYDVSIQCRVDDVSGLAIFTLKRNVSYRTQKRFRFSYNLTTGEFQYLDELWTEDNELHTYNRTITYTQLIEIFCAG